MTASLRVLQLLPALNEGGVEKSAVEMARYLNEKGVSNWIASAGGPLADEATTYGTRHLTIEVGRKSPLSIVSNARKIARLIDSEEINVVHALSRAPAWVGLLACRFFTQKRCHFVTTMHGAHSHANALKRLYNSSIVRGEVVVASSRFIRDHIIQIYGLPSERIIVASRGVDAGMFDSTLFTEADRQKIRTELAGAKQAPLLVMVGRITTLKGHLVLIDALSHVTDIPWHMAFVGDGNASVQSVAQARINELGLRDRITWTGSRRDIPAVLAASDLAFSASIRPEAFGLAAIEAQAMETPVIATDHGGSRETVLPGQTGWLVPPGDAEAMAVAIRDALSDPTRLTEMGRLGRAHVLANFTIRSMLEKEYSAYERAMREPLRR